MGAKIYSTSSIDAWINIPRIIVTFIYMAIFIGVLVFPFIQFDILEKLNVGGTGNVIIGIILLIGGIYLARYIFIITAARFFNTLSSYLYVRQELKTKISRKNAAYVSFLFTPNPTGKWYTMYGVLRLPEEQRLEYILNFADKLYAELNLKK